MTNRILDYPINSDISFIKLNTPVAVQIPSNEIIIRTTVGDICSQMAISYTDAPDPELYGWDKLTNSDRLNLCDIAWFLKGLAAADKSPFTDQIESLESVIKALGDKFRQ